MAQFGVPASLCDYCQQEPKRPPYDYCSKNCGSRANASGANTAICKQCGQRPVHPGHQFCGRNCAKAWQTMSHINTGWNPGQPQGQQQQWYTAPQMQSSPSYPTQPLQGFNQGGAFKGIVNGIKGLVSKGQQPQPFQQQLGPPNPPHMQRALEPISPNPGVSPSITPGFNQYYTPSTPTSPGIQGPNASGGQHPYPPPSIFPQTRAQSQFLIQAPTDAVDDGNGNGSWDPDVRNYSAQYNPTPSGPPATCRLNKCNKPVFVDLVSNLPSEYCSQTHREDALTSGQVDPCIMCLKMPRGLSDHFCSSACRERALNS